MLPRRIATFLVGAWIACSILIAVIVLQNPSAASRAATAPQDSARPLIERLGADQSQTLLRHFANEQSRAYLGNWEVAQLITTAVLLVLFVFSGQKWKLPVILTGTMGLLVLFQHFGLRTDLLYLGRQADFVRPEASYSLDSQMWTLTRTYGAMEAVKLICGGILASYLFGAEASVRARKRSRAEDPATHTAV